VYYLTYELIFETLLVYRQSFNTPGAAENWKTTNPAYSTFSVCPEDSVLDWQGQTVTVPFRERR
jgi:hypothetical protein